MTRVLQKFGNILPRNHNGKDRLHCKPVLFYYSRNISLNRQTFVLLICYNRIKGNLSAPPRELSDQSLFANCRWESPFSCRIRIKFGPQILLVPKVVFSLNILVSLIWRYGKYYLTSYLLYDIMRIVVVNSVHHLKNNFWNIDKRRYSYDKAKYFWKFM